jgi:2-iminobutanoate/2-iminopropanoate deaminase
MPNSDIELFHTPAPDDKRPFSRVAKAAGHVYVSGHSAPHDPDNGVFRGDTPQEEVCNSLRYINSLLEEAGSDLTRVVQMTMLISDKSDYAACNEEYVRHFPNGLPARHTARFGVPTEARVAFACIALTRE